MKENISTNSALNVRKQGSLLEGMLPGSSCQVSATFDLTVQEFDQWTSKAAAASDTRLCRQDWSFLQGLICSLLMTGQFCKKKVRSGQLVSSALFITALFADRFVTWVKWPDPIAFDLPKLAIFLRRSFYYFITTFFLYINYDTITESREC